MLPYVPCKTGLAVRTDGMMRPSASASVTCTLSPHMEEAKLPQSAAAAPAPRPPGGGCPAAARSAPAPGSWCAGCPPCPTPSAAWRPPGPLWQPVPRPEGASRSWPSSPPAGLAPSWGLPAGKLPQLRLVAAAAADDCCQACCTGRWLSVWVWWHARREVRQAYTRKLAVGLLLCCRTSIRWCACWQPAGNNKHKQQLPRTHTCRVMGTGAEEVRPRASTLPSMMARPSVSSGHSALATWRGI